MLSNEHSEDDRSFRKITTAKCFYRNYFPTVTQDYPSLYGTICSAERSNKLISNFWRFEQHKYNFFNLHCATAAAGVWDVSILRPSADKAKNICMTLISQGADEKMFSCDLGEATLCPQIPIWNAICSGNCSCDWRDKHFTSLESRYFVTARKHGNNSFQIIYFR